MFDSSSPSRFVFPVIVAVLVFFGVSYVADDVFDYWGESSDSSVLLEYERNTISVFDEAAPAVVFVHNLQNYRSYYSFDVTEVQSGTGSGFLWDDRGHIVTNFHVVQGADRVAVTLIDGNSYEARVVGVEPRKDLAVLKIDLQSTNVPTFSKKVADSSRLRVGQKALAIGNPYGLDHTLTVGNVSALERSMSSVVEGVTIRDMVQTDAAINPGNSGGPLLDSQGRLIGMNTLILKNSTGIGFAVPSNTIKRVVKQIIQYGKPIQAGIGMMIFEDRISRSFRVEGVIIRSITAGSPADLAGMRGTSRDNRGRLVLGDVIRTIDGEDIRNYDDMYNAFDSKKSGDTVDITYIREGKEISIRVEVVIVGQSGDMS